MNETDHQKMDGVYIGTPRVEQLPRPDDRTVLKRLTDTLQSNGAELTDLICGSTLALTVILGLCFWKTVSDVLFYKLWFPILALGEKLLIFLLLLFVAGLFLQKNFYTID